MKGTLALCLSALALACGGSIAAAVGIAARPHLLACGILGLSAAAGLAYTLNHIAADVQTMTQTLRTDRPILDSLRSPALKPLAGALRECLDKTLQPLQNARREIQELSLQLQLLRRRKSGIEAILNSIHDAVLVCDDQDRLISAQSRRRKNLGY
jgi:PAS domain-containing protein